MQKLNGHGDWVRGWLAFFFIGFQASCVRDYVMGAWLPAEHGSSLGMNNLNVDSGMVKKKRGASQLTIQKNLCPSIEPMRVQRNELQQRLEVGIASDLEGDHIEIYTRYECEDE